MICLHRSAVVLLAVLVSASAVATSIVGAWHCPKIDLSGVTNPGQLAGDKNHYGTHSWTFTFKADGTYTVQTYSLSKPPVLQYTESGWWTLRGHTVSYTQSKGSPGITMTLGKNGKTLTQVQNGIKWVYTR